MKTLKKLIPAFIFLAIFTSCSKDDDAELIIEPLTQREILMTIYNANPGVLNWDVENPDINTWSGVTTNSSGNVIILNLSNYASLDLRDGGILTIEERESAFLSGQKLTSIPKEIAMLENLTSLNLEYNNLETLPEEIGQLTNLTELILYGNPLSEGLPQAILDLGYDVVKIITKVTIDIL